MTTNVHNNIIFRESNFFKIALACVAINEHLTYADSRHIIIFPSQNYQRAWNLDT